MNTSTLYRFAIAAAFSVLCFTNVDAQRKNVAINTDGAAADSTALLDVSGPTSGVQKGFFAPRMTTAQRNTLCTLCGATYTGLTIYQTDGAEGFYYFDGTSWQRISKGANAWDLNGNDPVDPDKDFFGTTDNKPVVFRTNGVQRMVLTNQGYLGVNVAAPVQRLDVGGALRIFPTNGNAVTNAQGAILFQPGYTSPSALVSSSFSPFLGQPLRWAGHYGNVDGTAPVTTGINPLPGGWRRWENDYDEVAGTASQQGDATCGVGTAEITYGSTTFTNGLPTLTAAQQEQVTPFVHNGPAKRWRKQYLFLRKELNVELNQLDTPNASPTALQGLCPGGTIDSIAFWINTPVTAASQKLWTFAVTIKHAPLGLDRLTNGFDNSVDGSSVCVANSVGLLIPKVLGPAGWYWFKFNSPFTWDGLRNVIVEVACSSGNGNNPGLLPVKYKDTGLNLTYSVVLSLPNTGECAPTAVSSCSTSLVAPALISNPSVGCGPAAVFGPSTRRPVILFHGNVATAPAASAVTAGTYLLTKGGFISESTIAGSAGFPWGRWITNTPLGQAYDVFKGPGNISCERGVYDLGVRLNDHVFDRAFDGRVQPQDAGTFGDARNLSIDEMAEYTRLNRHLPTVRGRSAWNREHGFSFGELTNQIWSTAETQALYITDLNDRLNVLEMLTNDRPLNADELRIGHEQVSRMADLTEAEKARLIDNLHQRATGITPKR